MWIFNCTSHESFYKEIFFIVACRAAKAHNQYAIRARFQDAMLVLQKQIEKIIRLLALKKNRE